MPKVRKRIIDGDEDLRRSQPKKARSDQIDVSLNPEDDARDSENDPGYIESQEFLTTTGIKDVAKSSEVVLHFHNVLEDRKKTSLHVLSDHARNIKAKEYELRKVTIAILGAVSPHDTSNNSRNDGHQYSVFALSNPLMELSESNILNSKALLQQYRSVSQETTAARDSISTGSNSKEAIKYLQSLLDRRSERLRLEIHAMLRSDDPTGDTSFEDKAEKEVWGRFGGASTALKPIEQESRRLGEAWTECTENSMKALRRLVKHLPKDI